MIELCDGTSIEDDRISEKYLENNLVVHNFLMSYKNSQISEKRMLYGLINALAYRNEQLEQDIADLIRALPTGALDISFDD